MDTLKQIKKSFEEAEDKVSFITEVRNLLGELSPFSMHPVDNIVWINIDDIEANDYNPNAVAKNEMRLLYTSIKNDGYTQPVVVIYDKSRKKYVIVDGFHRYSIMKRFEDIKKTTDGMLPVVVIKKDINDRMASTIRHNRARGKHSIAGMGNMVMSLLEGGWSDSEICNKLGLEAEELVRLKYVTGFAKLFENVEYKHAWETRRQLMLKKEMGYEGS